MHCIENADPAVEAIATHKTAIAGVDWATRLRLQTAQKLYGHDFPVGLVNTSDEPALAKATDALCTAISRQHKAMVRLGVIRPATVAGLVALLEYVAGNDDSHPLIDPRYVRAIVRNCAIALRRTMACESAIEKAAS